MITYNLKPEHKNEAIINQLKSVLDMDEMDQEMVANVHGNLLKALDQQSLWNYTMLILGVVGDGHKEPTLAKLKQLIVELTK